MSLLLAPFNNAMRLGQGFNSYTQSILIDDAVIIDPTREENVIDNSGLTVKMLAERTGTLSVLERMPGLVESSVGAPSPRTESTDTANKNSTETTRLPVRPNDPASPKAKPEAPAAESTKPLTAEQRREERDKKLNSAAAAEANAMSVGEMNAKFGQNRSRIEDLLAKNTQSVNETQGHVQLPWTAQEAEGPGQTVTYTSKFVNKLSEITDEMSISGSLSIKYNAIGGSGSGAFFDAEKFYESDLRYLVSVKVVNQTLNYKDPLTFNPLRSCMRDQGKFNQTFGDAFVSGFLEGGEFNALILMKVHNKNKKRDIQAEAKVALTAGPVEVSAQGNVKLAEENIANNSETSVYVRWCGGGNIKPYDDEWNIKSAMAAAARFPALVGLYPQRTYAVLTKYESLRSYLLLKPVKLSPLRYELAQMYTNILLDSYMEYKSMTRRISSDIADIQAGLKEFQTVDLSSRPTLSSSLAAAGLNFFPATLTGLDDARKAIRNQMNIIVGEVDEMTDHPEKGSDPKRKQPYVGPVSFSILLPEVDLRNTRKRSNVAPLNIQRINTVDKPENAPIDEVNEDAPPLFDPNSTSIRPSSSEQSKLADLEWQSYGIGTSYQVSPPVGDQDQGTPFCTLDFAQSDESITEITAVVDAENKLTSIVLGYNNGLICTFGAAVDQKDLDSAPQMHKLVCPDARAHRIVSGKIQVLTYNDANNEPKQRVVGLGLSISKDRKIETYYRPGSSEAGTVAEVPFGVPVSDFKLSGLWGRMHEDGPDGGITRLGFIWGSVALSVATSSDQSDRPTSITSVSRSFWPNTRENNVFNEIKFPYPLLDTPRLILAPHYLKSAAKNKEDKDTESMERIFLSVSAKKEKLTEKGFELEARTRYSEDAFFCYWMVMPEFESTQIECGEADVADIQGKTREVEVTFGRSYPEDTTPDIRCWITAINALPSSEGGTIHVRAQVVPDSFTMKGFRLAVDVFGGTKVENIKIGWIAHTKPSKTNADFVSGDLLVDGMAEAKKEIKLASTLSDKPVSQFVAINEIEAETKTLISFAATFLPETSKEAVHLYVCNFGPSQVKKLGLIWILSM